MDIITNPTKGKLKVQKNCLFYRGYLKFSSRKHFPSRSVSVVTWDAEASVNVDPQMIGTSIEAYLSEKLEKLDEEQQQQQEQLTHEKKKNDFCVSIHRKRSSCDQV